MGCESLKNTGNVLPECLQGPIVGCLVSEEKFSLSKTNILLKTQWNTLLLADKPERVYFIYDKADPAIVKQREARIITSGSGEEHYAGATPLSFSFDINKPNFEEIRNKLLAPMANADVYVMYVTSEGYIQGKENSSGLIEAVRSKVFKNIKAAEGYGSTEKIVYTFSEKDPRLDLSSRYDVIPTDWSVFDLSQIVSVTLEQVSASATAVVVKATVAGSDGTIPVLGLVIGDWRITGTGTLSSVSYSTVTENYTFVTVGATDGDVIRLKEPKTSTKFYEEEAGLVLDVT